MFFKLLKVFLKESFGASRLFGSKVARSKGKVIGFAILFLYAFISIGLSTGTMFFMMGIQRELLLYVASYATGLGFLFSILQANGFLFQFKDYETIGALPIKPITLLSAKLVTMLVFIYAFIIAMTLPIFIVYYYYVPFAILNFIYLLVGFIILPLPAIIIGSFLSLLISRVSKHFAKANLIQTILLFLIFIVIFAVSMIGSISSQTGSFIPVWLIEAISNVYLPNEWYASAVHDGNAINFAFLFLSHIIIFGLFLFIVAKLSVKTNQNRTANKEVIIKSKRLRQAPIFWALLVKEWRRFIGTPIYIFNCSFGLIMLLIGSGAAIFFKNDIVGALGTFSPFAALLFFAFCLVTVYTPAVSLSLEGRNFALLKTLPIKGEDIMGAKIAFNLLLELPIVVLSLPLAAIGLGLDIWMSLASLVAIISFAVLTSIIFAWLNLFFPRFDFKTEAEVIKQSMSAFIAVLLGFGLIAMQGGILFALMLIPLPTLALPILFLSIVNGLLALVIYLPLRKSSSVRLQKMEV